MSCESVSLHGHSGPVYATQFSPDSSVLLSASEDLTGEFKINITDFYFWLGYTKVKLSDHKANISDEISKTISPLKRTR